MIRNEEFVAAPQERGLRAARGWQVSSPARSRCTRCSDQKAAGAGVGRPVTLAACREGLARGWHDPAEAGKVAAS